MSANRGKAWRRHQERRHDDRPSPHRSTKFTKPEKNRKLLFLARDKLKYAVRSGAQMRKRDWAYYFDGNMR